jgi:hypothetical protein
MRLSLSYHTCATVLVVVCCVVALSSGSRPVDGTGIILDHHDAAIVAGSVQWSFLGHIYVQLFGGWPNHTIRAQGEVCFALFVLCWRLPVCAVCLVMVA